MSRISINEDNIVQCVMVGGLALSVVLALATALLVSPKFGISVFAGGLLAIANFLRMRSGLESLLRTQPTNASRSAVMKFLLRLAMMAVLLYVLIVLLHADIIGVLVGLSVIVINIFGFSIYLSTRKGG